MVHFLDFMSSKGGRSSRHKHCSASAAKEHAKKDAVCRVLLGDGSIKEYVMDPLTGGVWGDPRRGLPLPFTPYGGYAGPMGSCTREYHDVFMEKSSKLRVLPSTEDGGAYAFYFEIVRLEEGTMLVVKKNRSEKDEYVYPPYPR